MECPTAIRTSLGGFLLLLFLMRVAVGETHRLWMHHEHGPASKCEASAGESHWHDTRAAHDCLLCALPVLTASLPEDAPYLIALLTAAPQVLLFASTTPSLQEVRLLPALRGPPVTG